MKSNQSKASTFMEPIENSPVPTPSLEARDSDSLVELLDKVVLASGIEAEGGMITLPIESWGDLDGLQTTFHAFHIIFAGVLAHYATLATASIRASESIPLDESGFHPFFVLARWLVRIECIIFKSLNELPHDIRNREDIINAATSLRRSLHSFAFQFSKSSSTSFKATAKSFFSRVHSLFFRPSRFVTPILDLCSLLRFFWDGRRPGPDLILPMASLTKRPSGRLSRLLLQHTRDLPHHDLGSVPRICSPASNPHQIIAVIDLNKTSRDNAKSGYSVPADIHSFAAMLLLLAILNFLLAPSWVVHLLSLHKILFICIWSVLAGDGELTLLPQSKAPGSIPAPAYAMLLDEELNLMLLGTQDLVEAIALGGFRLSYPFAGFLQSPAWKILANLTLEGNFQGLLCLMAILPVWRLAHVSIASPLAQLLVPAVLHMCINSIPMSLEILSRCTIKFEHKLPLQVGIPDPMAFLVSIAVEFTRISGRVIPLWVSWALYVHDQSAHNEFLLLLDQTFILSLLLSLSVPYQDYPVRTSKFLDVIGNPQVRKWRFRTPAAAATFQCLVLCHDTRRPVRSVDVRGMLDTLIPDQREVWRAWKERVADRITHEEDIIFAPTLPTFRDAKLQRQLKEYLAEAQHAYDVYRCQYIVEAPVSVPGPLPVPQHPVTEQPICPVMTGFKFTVQCTGCNKLVL